jgi:hypothetical protein
MCLHEKEREIVFGAFAEQGKAVASFIITLSVRSFAWNYSAPREQIFYY